MIAERKPNPGQFKPGRKWHGIRGRGRAKKTLIFREVVFEHVATKTPKQSHEIFKEIEENWGTTYKRKVIRALRYLLDEGVIQRDPAYFYTRKPGVQEFVARRLPTT
jgi:hypothetical protein